MSENVALVIVALVFAAIFTVIIILDVHDRRPPRHVHEWTKWARIHKTYNWSGVPRQSNLLGFTCLTSRECKSCGLEQHTTTDVKV